VAQTPNSASAAYVTPAEVLEMYSQEWLADMLRSSPSAPPPSYMAMIDPNNPACQRLQRHLNIGAGEIEAFCTVSARYQPTDLQALTGVSQQLLKKLNAARGVWSLAQFLKPLTARPEEVPMAQESMHLLALLQKGEAIFGLLQSQLAGVGPTVQFPNPYFLKTPNVVGRAQRLFVDYGPNRIYPGPNASG